MPPKRRTTTESASSQRRRKRERYEESSTTVANSRSEQSRNNHAENSINITNADRRSSNTSLHGNANARRRQNLSSQQTRHGREVAERETGRRGTSHRIRFEQSLHEESESHLQTRHEAADDMHEDKSAIGMEGSNERNDEREELYEEQEDEYEEDDNDDEGEDEEEEEEGEDLYGENFIRDYLEPDEEEEEEDASENALGDDIAEDNDNWIVDDDEVSSGSELSDGERAAVNVLIQRREEMEKRKVEEEVQQRRQLEEGVFSDVESSSSEQVEETSSLMLSSARSFHSLNDSASDDDDDNNDGESNKRRERRHREHETHSRTRNDHRHTSNHHINDTNNNFADPNEDVYVRGELESINFDWRHPQGDLVEWLAQELPRRVIKNRIYNFYLNYVENNVSVYEAKINVMTRENDQSFQLSYSHLSRVYESVLALWLVDVPDTMIELLEEAANYFTFRQYPHYRHVHAHIFVRICDLPICDPIRDFRQLHMNVLVRVEGVVVRRSPVYPQMYAMRYDCVRCGYVIGPIYQRGDREHKVSMCPRCHSKGPFRVNVELTEYRVHQTIILQESPSKVPAGRLPRSLEVILTNDLIDRAKPGEEVDVTGIYRNNFDPLMNSRQGFPVFTTNLEANNILRRIVDPGAFRLPDDERQRIMELSRHPNIRRKLICSVAPSIHGREDIKLGLLLAMMGGVAKDVGGDQSHRIRGDINVLLVGDPGCAKSQFLKFVEKTADRAVFTTGRGSTAVGLTASVHKDAITGDFVLEGGALVIADRGCCLIDEFDKMSDQDRTSIHEAMEQQTISVARGGIVTTLSARCCIIAAANPISGRYDPSTSFDANVNLTSPILSRFDLLFVVRDEVNVEADEQLARFICKSHMRNHPRSQLESKRQEREQQEKLTRLRYAMESTHSETEKISYAQQLAEIRNELHESRGALNEDDDPASDKPLSQSLFKRYILYAKSYCNPRVVNIDENTIARLYTELRQESRHGGIAITVRHMESIIRLSEAHARLHLREFVRDEDVTAAISLFLRCFLQTQKYSMRSAMERRFRKYLESDTEPIPLLQHRIRVAVQAVRQFERHLSGGVEPTRVRIDMAELEPYTSTISSEVLSKYFDSEPFKKEFRLICDPLTEAPVQIEHIMVEKNEPTPEIAAQKYIFFPPLDINLPPYISKI